MMFLFIWLVVFHHFVTGVPPARSVANHGDPGRGPGEALAGDGFPLTGVPRFFCMSLVAPFSPATDLALKGCSDTCGTFFSIAPALCCPSSRAFTVGPLARCSICGCVFLSTAGALRGESAGVFTTASFARGCDGGETCLEPGAASLRAGAGFGAGSTLCGCDDGMLRSTFGWPPDFSAWGWILRSGLGVCGTLGGAWPFFS